MGISLTHANAVHYLLNNALVFQWIECWSPKPAIWVRLPTGAPLYQLFFEFVASGFADPTENADSDNRISTGRS